jgi:hypothetical protein
MITLNLGEDYEKPFKRRREMEQLYRNVFGSPEGRVVLGDILRENHFGVPLNSDAQRIEYNVGVTIARMCGIMGEIDTLLKIGED